MDGVGQHKGTSARRHLGLDQSFTEADFEEERGDVQTAAEEEKKIMSRTFGGFPLPTSLPVLVNPGVP